MEDVINRNGVYDSPITSSPTIAMENDINTNGAKYYSEHSKPSIIILGEKSVTLSRPQLEHQAKLLQQRLAATGDLTQRTIAVALPNSIELVSLFLAITGSRAIAALLNPGNKENEFDSYLDDMDPIMVIVSKEANDADSDLVRAAKRRGSRIAECYWDGQGVVLNTGVQEERANGEYEVVQKIDPLVTDTALLLHTSGTTGRPKIVPLTRKNLDASAKNICKGYHLNADDRTMLLTPLFHVAGLLACLSTLKSQGAVVLSLRYSPASFWQDLVEHNVTWYGTTPAMHRLILQLPPPKVMPPRLRFIKTNSSPLPPALFRELESRLQVPVLDSYGLTETTSFCTSNPLPPGARLAGSVGYPQGPQVSIRDQAGASLDAGLEGEICLRGENIMNGYLNDPDANTRVFTPDGFFRSGDFGHLDAHGYLFVTGRMREFIDKGGEKISPVEIDNLVTRHPAVAEAATFSVLDDIYGQDIGLAVVMRDGEGVERSKLKRWIRDRISAHKVPAKVFIVQEIPKTATGKTRREVLSQQVAEGKLASST